MTYVLGECTSEASHRSAFITSSHTPLRHRVGTVLPSHDEFAELAKRGESETLSQSVSELIVRVDLV